MILFVSTIGAKETGCRQLIAEISKQQGHSRLSFELFEDQNGQCPKLIFFAFHNKRITFEPSLIFVETPSSLPILDSASDQGLRHADIVLESTVT